MSLSLTICIIDDKDMSSSVAFQIAYNSRLTEREHFASLCDAHASAYHQEILTGVKPAGIPLYGTPQPHTEEHSVTHACTNGLYFRK